MSSSWKRAASWLARSTSHQNRDPFIDLTRRVWGLFPDWPPYGGEFLPDIIPHLTAIAITRTDHLLAAHATHAVAAHAGSHRGLLVGGDHDGGRRIACPPHRQYEEWAPIVMVSSESAPQQSVATVALLGH
jgi:hypothetical protein